jgi:hypothetical protein
MERVMSRRHGKVEFFKRAASAALDMGKRVCYASLDRNVVIERVDGVDYVINEDGTRDIEGSGLLRCNNAESRPIA